jgi:hypothetical protein
MSLVDFLICWVVLGFLLFIILCIKKFTSFKFTSVVSYLLMWPFELVFLFFIDRLD